MRVVLVVNSGSSSLKYQLLDMETEQTLASGLVERIAAADGSAWHSARTQGSPAESRPVDVPDHTAAFRVMLDAFAASGPDLRERVPLAVGHRVVQGGERYTAPTVVSDAVIRGIEELSVLAPLHNPANLQGIAAAREAFPGVPHVAVFDTAFHRTLPPEAYTYAIDADLARAHGVRRYGFHGTSHRFVAEAAASFLARPVGELRQIVLHLGNGASACAIDRGRSVETSMGMTPLEGLVMGTRSGDLDPALPLHLAQRLGVSLGEVDSLLNRRSGLLGLAGSNDVRDLTRAAEGGDTAARLALEVYAHRIRHYIGGYLAQLGGLDALVFTAGVGENSAVVREAATRGLSHLGIHVDFDLNRSREGGARRISPDGAPVAVLVVPTDEELQIARETLHAMTGAGA